MKTYDDLNDYEVLYLVSEDTDAMEEIIFNKYLPVVIKEAKKYYEYGKNLGLEHDDFIQEGYCALYMAIRNFDSTKNTLFYTYVTCSIKRKMINLLRRNMTYKQKLLNESISLDMQFDDDGTSLLELVVDNKVINPLEQLEKSELENRIRKILFGFDIDVASVIELKMNGFTKVDIAKLLNINYKTVSSVLFRIRKKLRFNN